MLFSVFINGFAKYLKGKGFGGVEVGEDRLHLLLFADDIVMFAENGDELQEMINVLEEYCKKWRFEINVGKSKVMVCGSKKQIQEEEMEWRYGQNEMGRVKKYKYVGAWVNEECTWKEQILKVGEKAEGKSVAMRWWLFRQCQSKSGRVAGDGGIGIEVWGGKFGGVARWRRERWRRYSWECIKASSG